MSEHSSAEPAAAQAAPALSPAAPSQSAAGCLGVALFAIISLAAMIAAAYFFGDFAP
jgi:hypothetical protein